MVVSIPEGWKTRDFGVKLKDGKPPGTTAWFDVNGRPVIKNGSVWKLQKQKPAPPRRLTPQEIEQKNNTQPKSDLERGKIKLTPQEQEKYHQFANLAKEKIVKGTKKSFYPNPEQAKIDEKNRQEAFAPFINLSDDQLSAINAYTSEWDLNMNSLLRTGKVEASADQRLGSKEKPSDTQVKKAIQDLTSALEQLPKQPRGVFHRAISGSVWSKNGFDKEASDFLKQINSLQEGDVIEDPGFSSFTSGKSPVVDRFLTGSENSDQNVVFEVESDQMRDVSKISRYEQEKECMLPPGAKFKVIGRKEGWSRKVGKHLVLQIKQLS